VLQLTPFQTVGPYLSLGLRVGVDTPATGPNITIKGRLLDGAGTGIGDGVIEWWNPAFATVRRSLTAEDGSFALTTVRPPSTPDAGHGDQAPHIAVRVLARGILTQYVTRLYFPGEPLNESDVVLQRVPVERRHTLIASETRGTEYHFDIVVQGANETAFFDV
jgi:protocatechuate 3,4-dioxygenase alpha subunit